MDVQKYWLYDHRTDLQYIIHTYWFHIWIKVFHLPQASQTYFFQGQKPHWFSSIKAGLCWGYASQTSLLRFTAVISPSESVAFNRIRVWFDSRLCKFWRTQQEVECSIMMMLERCESEQSWRNLSKTLINRLRVTHCSLSISQNHTVCHKTIHHEHFT